MFMQIKQYFKKSKRILKFGVASLFLGLYAPSVFAYDVKRLLEPFLDLFKNGVEIGHYGIYVIIAFAVLGAIFLALRKRLTLIWILTIIGCALAASQYGTILEMIGLGSSASEFASRGTEWIAD